VRTEQDLREALAAAEQHAPAAGPLLARVSVRWARRRRLRIGLSLGATALAAGVAAAVVVTQLPAAPVAHNREAIGRRTTAPAGHVTLTARQVLLRAAATAAAATGTGTYWQVEEVTGSLLGDGSAARVYAVDQRSTPVTSWDASSADRRTWTLPATGDTTTALPGGATQSWQAAGSPKLPSSTGQQQAFWQVGGQVANLGNEPMTFAQLRALPSDSAALATRIRKEIRQEDAEEHLTQDMTIRTFQICAQLLKAPLPAQVRAAVFRVLAALPGVRSTGTMTDPLGRSGYGIALGGGTASGGGFAALNDTVEEVLVISPASGLLVDDELVQTQLPAGVQPASSGAVPGFASCRAILAAAAVKGTTCVPSGVKPALGTGTVMAVTLPDGEQTMVQLGQPLLAVPDGTVVTYDAVVSAGWTDAAPPLPPASEQFNAANHGVG
jgi:hypothetical protein